MHTCTTLLVTTRVIMWADYPWLVRYGDSPYIVLGVQQDDSNDDFRAAFRSAIMRFHPDTGGDTADVGRAKAVLEAWNVLRDPVKRAQFDDAGEYDSEGHEDSGSGSDVDASHSDFDAEEGNANRDAYGEDSSGLPKTHDDSNFRLRACRVMLTFSALLPNELTHDILLNSIQTNVASMQRAGTEMTIMEYAVGREIHKQPARASHNTHFHIVLYLSSRLDTTNPRAFDIVGTSGAPLHPNIRTAQTQVHYSNMVRYALKEEHPQNMVHLKAGSIKEFFGSGVAPTAKRKWSKLVTEVAEESVSAAMRALYEQYPDVFLLHAATIEANLCKVAPSAVVRPVDLASFIAPWDEPLDFHVTSDGQLSAAEVTIVFVGPTATGKTYRALAEMERPLLISNGCLETLKDIVASGPHATTHLVFDEFDYRTAGKGGKPLSTEECLGLINPEFPCTLNVRYGVIKIPALPRIFTTNRTLTQYDHIFPQGNNALQAAALARRYRPIYITEPMWT